MRGILLTVLLSLLLGGPSVLHPASATEGDLRASDSSAERWAPGVAGSVTSQVLGTRPLPAVSSGAGDGDRERTASWGWPLAGVPEIARGFDPPEQRWGAGHRGIDLIGVLGEPVLATEAGVVSYSGVIAGVGVVSITHADGLRSTYQPVDDRLPRASRVGRGERIGTLDVGGHCLVATCLHLGALRGEEYVDPTPLLLGVELTLLPVDP